MSSFYILLPTLVIGIGGVVVAIMSAMNIEDKMKKCATVSVGFLAFALMLQLTNFADDYSLFIYPQFTAKALKYDTFANYFQVLLTSGALLTMLVSKHYVEKNSYFRAEFFALLMLSLFGMIFLSMATELITAFISLEIASMSIYALVGFNTKGPKRIEAMYRYLVLGAFIGGFFLLGASLVFLQVGSLNLVDIATYATKNGLLYSPLLAIGTTLIISTFLFKIGAFPFQNWTLDVYDGAPLPVTLYMASTLKVAVFAFFIRLFLESLTQILSIWDGLFMFIIIATLIYGSFLAIIQKSVKRMLISSSIVHSGYLLMAFLAMNHNAKEAGASVMFYLFAYFLSAIGSFGLISYLSSDNKNRVSYDDFKGFATERPYMAAMMTIFMFSLAGIPSTIGFIGKFYIFTATIKSGYPLLALLGILATFVSIYYYFKLVAVMYFYPKSAMQNPPPLGALSPIIIGLLAILVIWGGIGTGLVFFLPIPGIDILMEIAKNCIGSLAF